MPKAETTMDQQSDSQPPQAAPAPVLVLKAWIATMRLKFQDWRGAVADLIESFLAVIVGLILCPIVLVCLPVTAAIAVIRCRKKVAWQSIDRDWTWSGKRRPEPEGGK